MTNERPACDDALQDGQKHAWWSLTLWIVFIFIMSSQSSPYANLDQFMGLTKVLTQLNNYDKYIHTSIWAVLTFLLWYATIDFRYKNNAQHIMFVVTIATFFGSADEFHQYFVPQRTSSLLDLAADCTGTMIALVLIYFFSTLKNHDPIIEPQAQPET